MVRNLILPHSFRHNKVKIRIFYDKNKKNRILNQFITKHNLMRKQLFFMVSMLLVLVLSSCNKDLKPLDPSLFTCTPNPLELKGGKVDATITGTFPVKYFSKNATKHELIPGFKTIFTHLTQWVTWWGNTYVMNICYETYAMKTWL